MAFEIPTDQIRDLQILLRKEANLSWYQPENDTSLNSISKLPSVLDTIAELDPSPPDLRCQNCKGRLLRGAESLFCVFCGSHPNKELSPEPIKFRSTIGYRWLLDSLHLDETDLASPLIEAGLSNKKSAAKDDVRLSALLDVTIRWSSESDSSAYDISTEKLVCDKGAFSDGAELDNFFSPRASANETSQKQLDQNKLNDSTTSDSFQNALGTTEKNLSLFENLHSSETTIGHTEGEIGSSSSDWEANFQSANSRMSPEKSKSDNPFVGSSADLTAHMDTVFGSGVDAKAKNDASSSLASAADDWFQGGVWSHSNLEISGPTGKPETTRYLNEGYKQEHVDNSSNNFNWAQDDPWQNITSKAVENKIPVESDNLFDAWNDFPSSTTAFDSFHSAGEQTANQTSLSVERNAHVDLFSSLNKSNDLGFEAFSQSDFISAPVNSSSASTRLNSTQSESLLPDRYVYPVSTANIVHTETSTRLNSTQSELPDRVSEMHPIIGDGETFKSEDLVGSKSETKEDENVKMLISQMHDLSFMLKSNLSIPLK